MTRPTKAPEPGDKLSETAHLLNEAQAKLLVDLRETFDRAEKCADPGEKFLLLECLAKEIDRCDREARRSITERAATRLVPLILSFATSAGAVAGVFGAGFALPLLMIIGFPIAIAGATCVYVGDNRANKARDRLTEESRPLFEALEAQKRKGFDLAAAMLSEDLLAIAESKSFPAIIQQFPQVRDEFTAAIQRGDLIAKKPEPTLSKSPDSGFRL